MSGFRLAPRGTRWLFGRRILRTFAYDGVRYIVRDKAEADATLEVLRAVNA